MIKSNTLPDIYRKEEKRKKKPRNVTYYIHKETKNVSFLKMYALLKMLDIENNQFFLALYDTKLINVNPHDPDLDLETQSRVIREIKVNPWYFLREVVRIPVAGSAKGSGKKYELHRGNLAITFCALNNLNSYTELPRQVGKSVAVDCILLWLYNFGTSNSQMMLMNKDHNEAKNNLGRILNIRSALPEYLRFDTRMGAAGKRLKIPENKESMKHHMNNNELVTKPKATSPNAADKLGRGCTQPVQWYDEFAFLDYNDLIYKSATLAVSTASEEAAKNGMPYGKIITSTPGDVRTKYGKYAYDFIHERSAIFSEKMYDWTMEDIREYIERNSKNGFLYVKFSYKQLGRSQKYFEKQVVELDGDMEKVRREVLLHWNVGSDDSPFDKDDIEELEEMSKVKPIIRTLRLNKFYMLNLYDEIDMDHPTIISVDVAAGHKKDSSAIALINSKTKTIIGEFVNNKIDPTNLSALIYTIATVVAPKCVICIERNNAGEGVISNLKATDIRHKLFFLVDKNVINEKRRNGHVLPDENEDSIKYGVWTGPTEREQMYDLLVKFVVKYKSRIAIQPMLEQIKTLAFIKERIDHMPGFHDDLIMAYLIGMWAYYYGNIIRFNIIPFPDFEENEEELLKKFEEENSKPLYDSDLFTNEIQNEEEQTMQFDEYKTIDDFYKEVGEERAYHMALTQTSNPNFDPDNSIGIDDASVLYQHLYTGNDSVQEDESANSFIEYYN